MINAYIARISNIYKCMVGFLVLGLWKDARARVKVGDMVKA